MRGGFAPLPRGVNVPLSGETWSARDHAATTCNVAVDVTGALPNRLCFLGSKAALLPRKQASRGADRASGRPRSRCVVRRVSPHRAYLADDDERCRVSVRPARVTVRPKGPTDTGTSQPPAPPATSLYLHSVGSNPAGTSVRTAPLEQAVSGGRPERPIRVGRGLEGSCCLVLAEGRFDDRSDRVSLSGSSPGPRTGEVAGEKTFAE